MEIFKRLSKKGYKPYYEGTVEELDSMSKDNQHLHSEIIRVIMWLYEKHSLWILPLPTVTGHFAYKILDVQLDPEKHIERPPYNDVSAEDFNTPTEAYEAAIEYCVKNLI